MIKKNIFKMHKYINEEDHVCILGVGDFNVTPGSPRFNEICEMLHESNVMFWDTDINK